MDFRVVNLLDLFSPYLETLSELAKLHKQFVFGGILTEAEFWATRKKLLDGDNNRSSKQRVGFKSAMISDIKPLADGRTNKVAFNLTPEIIHQIFTEKPVVHQAFLKYVPNKIDFWTKYYRAEYLRSTKNAVAAAVEATEDEELAVFLKQDDTLASEARRKDNGISRDCIKEVAESQSLYDQYKRNLLQDLNRHAVVVLEGQSIVIDDLQAPHEPPIAPLCIKDPRDYFYSQQANALRTLGEIATGAKPVNYHTSTREAYSYISKSISDIKSEGIHDSVVKSGIASKVLNSLTHNISSTKYNLRRSNRETVLDSLPSMTKEELLYAVLEHDLDFLSYLAPESSFQHWTSIQELLKHFWSSYPIRTPYLSTKVNKLKDAMANIYGKLQGIKESVQSDLRHQVSLLVQPMVQYFLDPI
ncbi:hypothetical protein Cgig2_000784 [Carnegiea gigantea]|uniref:BSD domain-containing protein n=1 Tax=Carnegiea gigantea TaxID=171969 RepID=A0A9Q1QL77_9CARY|nr:hypothetical protein Cgig2_000784 [Carnegiea gigantea]